MAASSIASKTNVICVGAGGHAASVLGTMLEEEKRCNFILVDADKSKHGQQLFNVKIVGSDEYIPNLIKEGFTHFLVTVGVVKPSAVREKIYSACISLGLKPYTFVSRQALVSKFAKIGSGSVVMPGAIINPLSVIGSNTIINTGAVVEHEAIIDDCAHIAPNATVLGGAHVHKNAYIGAGSVVKQNIAVNQNSMIGAGAVVVENVAKNTTVKGVPAK